MVQKGIFFLKTKKDISIQPCIERPVASKTLTIKIDGPLKNWHEARDALIFFGKWWENCILKKKIGRI